MSESPRFMENLCRGEQRFQNFLISFSGRNIEAQKGKVICLKRLREYRLRTWSLGSFR